MDISGLNLLLVEDNELNAEIAKTLLSDEGANRQLQKMDCRRAVDVSEKPERIF